MNMVDLNSTRSITGIPEPNVQATIQDQTRAHLGACTLRLLGKAENLPAPLQTLLANFLATFSLVMLSKFAAFETIVAKTPVFTPE